jgi:hypothetical protein
VVLRDHQKRAKVQDKVKRLTATNAEQCKEQKKQLDTLLGEQTDESLNTTIQV